MDVAWVAAIAALLSGVGAILTGINALISTRSADAQALIASRKLNLDLYDRRYAVWKSVVDEVSKLINWAVDEHHDGYGANEIVQTFEDFAEDMGKYSATSQFLFVVEVSVEIEKVALSSQEAASALLPYGQGPATDKIRKMNDDLRAFTHAVTPYLDFTVIGLPTPKLTLGGRMRGAGQLAVQNWRDLAQGFNTVE